ncbi:uncharacterized protein METZ01_LOCUS462809 [marine metagenome]|uniref:Uncharacterized protein n=1 Tax=marine metagenome TaxID=408172 RepID=A0A383ARW1_9ZZZZ
MPNVVPVKPSATTNHGITQAGHIYYSPG